MVAAFNSSGSHGLILIWAQPSFRWIWTVWTSWAAPKPTFLAQESHHNLKRKLKRQGRASHTILLERLLVMLSNLPRSFLGHKNSIDRSQIPFGAAVCSVILFTFCLSNNPKQQPPSNLSTKLPVFKWGPPTIMVSSRWDWEGPSIDCIINCLVGTCILDYLIFLDKSEHIWSP